MLVRLDGQPAAVLASVGPVVQNSLGRQKLAAKLLRAQTCHPNTPQCDDDVAFWCRTIAPSTGSRKSLAKERNRSKLIDESASCPAYSVVPAEKGQKQAIVEWPRDSTCAPEYSWKMSRMTSRKCSNTASTAGFCCAEHNAGDEDRHGASTVTRENKLCLSKLDQLKHHAVFQDDEIHIFDIRDTMTVMRKASVASGVNTRNSCVESRSQREAYGRMCSNRSLRKWSVDSAGAATAARVLAGFSGPYACAAIFISAPRKSARATAEEQASANTRATALSSDRKIVV